MKIDARNFVLDSVIFPAKNHPQLEPRFKQKIQRSENLIRQFKKTGDLAIYLERFKTINEEDEMYQALSNLNLKTFEDIYPVFKEQFEIELTNTTNLDDFVIGMTFSSFDISIFAKQYNTQPGIYLIGDEPNYYAIFIKVTLSGGRYPNTWLIPNKELKYYTYSRTLNGLRNFNINYKYNQAIINSGDIPIYTFIKQDLDYKLEGIFEYIEWNSEDEKKWFRLRKKSSIELSEIISQAEFESELNDSIEQAKQSAGEDRQARLSAANKIPDKIQTVVTNYKRNPDVIVEVLNRADGKCEICNQPAPFIRRSNHTPYLEIHHKIQLADEGEDTIENAIAVCPNCHRKEHYGLNFT